MRASRTLVCFAAIAASASTALAQPVPDPSAPPAAEAPASVAPAPAEAPPPAPAPSPAPAPPRAEAGTSIIVQAPAPAPAPVPRMVEKGGGPGRALAYVTLVLGITGGVVALGAFAASQAEIFEESEAREIKGTVQDVALGAGVGSAALLGTSLVLFLATDASHTEVVYDPPPPPTYGAAPPAQGFAPAAPPAPRGSVAAAPSPPPGPLAAELPWGAYGFTLGAVGLGVIATMVANSAANALQQPENHPTRGATESAVLRAEDTRAVAAFTWVLAGGSAVWATVDTVRAVARHNRAEAAARARVGIAPTRGGAALAISGRF